MNVTTYDPFIANYVKRFQNITFLDPSLTIDDLWSEAYEIYTKLLNTPLTCEFITALGRQIEQRFLDLYKTAKRLNNHLDREQFIENFAAKSVKVSRLQFEELPSHVKELVKRIYDCPEEIAKLFPKNHIGKTKLINFLTKELHWQRRNAIDFASHAAQTCRKPCLKSSEPLQINV
jgi:hypothetical protein